MSVETDDHGRLYLPADLRNRYGEKFHVVEYDDRIELIPIDDDPLQAVRSIAGEAVEGRSTDELLADAHERAEREAHDERDWDGRTPETDE